MTNYQFFDMHGNNIYGSNSGDESISIDGKIISLKELAQKDAQIRGLMEEIDRLSADRLERQWESFDEWFDARWPDGHTYRDSKYETGAERRGVIRSMMQSAYCAGSDTEQARVRGLVGIWQEAHDGYLEWTDAYDLFEVAIKALPSDLLKRYQLERDIVEAAKAYGSDLMSERLRKAVEALNELERNKYERENRKRTLAKTGR